jgi:hypothetical protein
MATKTFTSFAQGKKILEKSISIAVKNTALIMTETLKEFISEDFYELYTPKFYIRSYDFLNSAVYNLLSSTSAEIKMDETMMDYGEYWDGETQLFMADAGYHGNASIYRDGHFWKDFMNWCNANVTIILRDELEKQGIKTY